MVLPRYEAITSGTENRAHTTNDQSTEGWITNGIDVTRYGQQAVPQVRTRHGGTNRLQSG